MLLTIIKKITEIYKVNWAVLSLIAIYFRQTDGLFRVIFLLYVIYYLLSVVKFQFLTISNFRRFYFLLYSHKTTCPVFTLQFSSR